MKRYEMRLRIFLGTNNSTTRGIICPSKVPSRLDLNLPSIAIPNLKNSITIRRTVTNVGDVNSMYKLVVKSPRNSVIKLSPDVLKFDCNTRKLSFEVKHYVRIPIAVRK